MPTVASDLTGRRRMLALAGTVGCLATAYTIGFNPHDASSTFPLCPTKLMTGLDCPACGGLRLVHDAGHGDLSAMLHDNLLLLVLSPLLVLLLWRYARRTWRGESTRLQVPRWMVWAIAGVAIAWMVVRNLPGWPLKPSTS
jgi:hypothetical protein